jgi:hypothetical protein
MNKRLLTIKEFCAIYSVGPTHVWKLIGEGKLKTKKIGSRGTRITADSADEWFASLPGPDLDAGDEDDDRDDDDGDHHDDDDK